MVFDVRSDDLANLFIISDDGSLSARPNLDDHERDRAAWNVTLLRLDLRNPERSRLLEKLSLVKQLRGVGEVERTEPEQQVLDILEHALSEHLSMLDAFDLPLTDGLRQRLEALAHRAREA